MCPRDLEISLSDIVGFSPDKNPVLWFDLLEEELSHPQDSRCYINELPSSHQKQLENTALQRAAQQLGRVAEQRPELLNPDFLLQQSRKRALPFLARTWGDNSAAEAKRYQVDPALLWRRCLGATIDLVVTIALALAFSVSMVFTSETRGSLFAFQPIARDDLLLGLIDVFSVAVISWFVMSTILIAFRGQTVGQRLMGLAVFTIDGQALGLTQSALRACHQFTTFFTCFLGILTALGRKRQTLHDFLARTVVGYVGKNNPIMQGE